MPESDSEEVFDKTREQSNRSDETGDTGMMDEDDDFEYDDDVLEEDDNGADDQDYSGQEVGYEDDADDDNEDGDPEDDIQAHVENRNTNSAEYEDDDDDFDDDVPLDAQLKNEPTLGGGLDPEANGHMDAAGGSRPDVADGDGDDSDDNVPLASRIPAVAKTRPKVQAKAQPKEEPRSASLDESGSEDDIPLAQRMRSIHDTKQEDVSAKKRRAPLRKGKTTRKKRKVEAKSPSKSPRASRKSATKAAKARAIPAKRVRKEKEDEPTRRFEKKGQRRETPPDTDPARLFYQSLYEQKLANGKRSAMAESWMLRHGLLEDRVAEEVLSRLNK